MEAHKRNKYSYHRKKLKWAVRNNFVFFVVVGIIGLIIGLVFVIVVLNHERVKSMESILGKNFRTLHRVTGMTDDDIEKLKKAHPNFNWEGTWDRERWQGGQEQMKKDQGALRAKRDRQVEKKKRQLQLESKHRQYERAMSR